MAVTLGKRKRIQEPSVKNQISGQAIHLEVNDNNNDDDLKTQFQKAFEAKFKPLDTSLKLKTTKPPSHGTVKNLESASDSSSDWSGLTDEDDLIEVIEDDSAHHTISEDTLLSDKKSFMVIRPPQIPPYLPN